MVGWISSFAVSYIFFFSKSLMAIFTTWSLSRGCLISSSPAMLCWKQVAQMRELRQHFLKNKQAIPFVWAGGSEVLDTALALESWHQLVIIAGCYLHYCTSKEPCCGLGTQGAYCHKSRAKGRVRPRGSRSLQVCPVVSGGPHQPKGHYGHPCGPAASRADWVDHVYLVYKCLARDVRARSYLAQIHSF